jgi:hypothetical protein
MIWNIERKKDFVDYAEIIDIIKMQPNEWFFLLQYKI